MFGRGMVAAIALALAGCITVSGEDGEPGKPGRTAETVSDGTAAQPYPGTSKDAEFFKNTPAAFRPFVETCNPWDDWDKPAPPFRIHGRTYYVGTCGIAAILIQGSDGHALIDSGTEAGADVVLANLRKIGVNPSDIRVLFNSHEHFDHVGGMAKLQQATGADVISSSIGIQVMKSGNTHADDPQHGIHETMKPIALGYVYESQTANGYLTYFGITPFETPGHTPGAMSWQWESCEDDRCFTIVYADSLSPVSSDEYKFGERSEYLAAYYEGLELLGRLDCDILLTPHPSHSRMLRRMRDDTMVEPGACAYYAIGKANDLEQRLEREASATE